MNLELSPARSSFQCVVVDSRFLGNFSQCFAAVSLCHASISHVLFTCCPSAIFRGIRSIVVYAINLMIFGRARTHVLEKPLKRIFPFVTHKYSPSSVAFVRGMRLGFATLPHRVPSHPLWRTCHSVFRHCDIALKKDCTYKASTRPCYSVTKTVTTNDLLFSARAHALPSGFISNSSCSINNSQSSKNASNQVNRFHC